MIDPYSWNNEMYKKYPTHRGVKHTNPIVRYIEDRRMLNVQNYCEDFSDKIVLEVGCEEGLFLERIPKVYKSLFGLDISSEALKDAKKKKNLKGVRFVQANITKKTKFKNNYFDIIICSETLEHIPDYRNALKEMTRILKKGGIMAFSVPYEKSLTNLKRFFAKLKLFNLLFGGLENTTSEWHINFFDKKSIRDIFQNDYDIKQMKYVPFPLIGPKLVMKAIKKS